MKAKPKTRDPKKAAAVARTLKNKRLKSVGVGCPCGQTQVNWTSFARSLIGEMLAETDPTKPKINMPHEFTLLDAKDRKAMITARVQQLVHDYQEIGITGKFRDLDLEDIEW